MGLLGFLNNLWAVGDPITASHLNNMILNPIEGVATPTAGYLTGGTAPSATSVFDTLYAGANNAKIKIDVDGVVYDNVPVTLQASNTTTTIAAAVQAAIRAVTGGLETCVYSTNKYVITSGTTGQASQVLKLMTPTSGTDISGNNATKYLDCGTGATETYGKGHSANRVAMLIGGITPSATSVFDTLGQGANNGKIKISVDGAVYDNIALDLTSLSGENTLVNTTAGTIGGNSPSALWQTFTTDGTQRLISKITLGATNGNAGAVSVTMNLRLTNSTGTIVKSVTISMPTGSWVNHDFVFNQLVNPNTVYCLEIAWQANVYYCYTTTDLYAGGSCSLGNDTRFAVYTKTWVNITTSFLATALQTAIRAATSKTEVVVYNPAGYYTVKSSITSPTSSVLKFMTPATGTDLSGVGATRYFDLATNATEVAMYSDYGKVAKLDENGIIPIAFAPSGYIGVFSSPATQTINCGFRVKRVEVYAHGFRGGYYLDSNGFFDGVNNKCAWRNYATSDVDNAKVFYILSDGGSYYGIISNVTDTGFDITVTTTGSFVPGASLMIKAF